MKKAIYYSLIVFAILCFLSYFVSKQWYPYLNVLGLVSFFIAIIILRTDKTNTLLITDKAKAKEQGTTFIEFNKNNKWGYTLFKLSLLIGIPALVLMAVHPFDTDTQGINGLIYAIGDSITLKVLLPVFSIALIAAWANIIMGIRVVKGNSAPVDTETPGMKKHFIRLFLFWLSILAGLSGIGLLFWCPSPNHMTISFFLPFLSISLIAAWVSIIRGRKVLINK